MKKILFVLPHMLCGGVEKALLAILEVVKNEYDVTVCLVKEEGEFVDLIPDQVKKIEVPLDGKVREQLMLGGIKASAVHYAKKAQIFNFIKLTKNILSSNNLPTLLVPFEKLDHIQEKFDAAVCFHMHMPFIVRYVAEKVQAENKYIWVHNDFSNSGFNISTIKKYLIAYNQIFVVTEQLKEEFIRLCPEYKQKVDVFHNLVSEKTVMKMAEQDVAVELMDVKKLKFLTMGRLDIQKGYDLALDVCSNLIEKGLQFTWYILGNGMLEQHLKTRIKNENLEGYVQLLGIRKNPYPYLKECDIYIQPSKHEGYGIAVAEARVLHKPIICTDFTGARDQIKDNITGKIVPYNVEDLTAAILEVANSIDIRKYYSENLALEKVDSDDEINLLKELFSK